MINHILSIDCPQCRSLHEWNTTNPDPRCYRCKYESQQHVVPRRAVVEMNERMSERLREAEARAATLQDRFNAQYDKIADQKNEIAELERRLKTYEPVSQYNCLSIEEWRTAALKAESEARTEKSIREVYMRKLERRLKLVTELRETIKINEDFIRLQGERLKALLAQLERVRQACDGGKGLDP